MTEIHHKTVKRPSVQRLESLVLQELEAWTGSLEPHEDEIQDLVTKHFPERYRHKAWQVVAKAIWNCVRRGEVWNTAEGESFRITDIGLVRLLKEGLIPDEKVHGYLKRLVSEIGSLLGRYSVQEYREGSYVYDIVWKQAPFLPRATHVFEIQHKGSVEEALVKLKHAYDIWGSRLFLVLTRRRDLKKAENLFGPLLKGAFHEIAGMTCFLGPEDVAEFWEGARNFSIIADKLFL